MWNQWNINSKRTFKFLVCLYTYTQVLVGGLPHCTLFSVCFIFLIWRDAKPNWIQKDRIFVWHLYTRRRINWERYGEKGAKKFKSQINIAHKRLQERLNTRTPTEKQSEHSIFFSDLKICHAASVFKFILLAGATQSTHLFSRNLAYSIYCLCMLFFSSALRCCSHPYFCCEHTSRLGRAHNHLYFRGVSFPFYLHMHNEL